MKVHYLQHVPYERVGWIKDWAESRRHELSGTLMFADPPSANTLPDKDGIDLLVIMGGPMNVYEHDKYPWLPAEKGFIGACIEGGKAVLGICLGGQLLADVLGGEVTHAPYEEIGWYPVEFTEAGRQMQAFAHFPDRFTALQWHGDTFSIPPGATHAAFSEACENQAFSFDGGRVIAMQFHLEETQDTLTELVDVAGGNLPTRASGRAAAEAAVTGTVAATDMFAAATDVSAASNAACRPWVSAREDLLAPDAPFDACRELLFGLLDRMAMR